MIKLIKKEKPVKIVLDFIELNEYLEDVKYFRGNLAEEILEICDEKGQFKLDDSLRKKIHLEEKASLIDKNLKVKTICYKSNLDHIHYLTPNEYVGLGRKNQLNLETQHIYKTKP